MVSAPTFVDIDNSGYPELNIDDNDSVTLDATQGTLYYDEIKIGDGELVLAGGDYVIESLIVGDKKGDAGTLRVTGPTRLHVGEIKVEEGSGIVHSSAPPKFLDYCSWK
ncbi:hypothetical protein JCM19233_1341 [Vibrio astriarenae]|nr:hypothetical protein JCM19233_1341 [Vibrio sp. C7]